MLRQSISSTRKFFQRTLGSLKSLFSGSSYEKLPKSPPNKPFSGSATTAGFDTNCAIQKMSFQGELPDKADHKVSANGSINDTNKITSKSTKQDHIDHEFNSISAKANSGKKMIVKKKIDSGATKTEAHLNKMVIVKRSVKDNLSSAKNGQEYSKYSSKAIKNYVLVEKKLKELEMLDMSNVDHVLDIEEVLHYYSRLTCPAYLEIVDKFFVEIFAESFGSSTPVHSINSGMKLNTAKI